MPSSMDRRLGAVAMALVTAAAVALPSRAEAQEPSPGPSAADVLFRRGRAAFKRGDFAAACESFAESQRLDPAAGTPASVGLGLGSVALQGAS